MSGRTLSTLGGTGGGPVRLAVDPGKPRGIHVTIANPTAVTHGAFFARSRRELAFTPQGFFAGFAVIAVPNSVANATIGTVAYTSFVFQAYSGELWAIADIDATIVADVLDSSVTEK